MNFVNLCHEISEQITQTHTHAHHYNKYTLVHFPSLSPSLFFSPLSVCLSLSLSLSPSSLHLPLTHTQGIGLNAQGFANAILFCAFTKQVREQLKRSSKTTWQRLKNCCVGVERRPDSVGGDYSFQDEKVKVLINSKRTYGSSVLEESELIDSLAE